MTRKRGPEPYADSIESPTQSASYHFADAEHLKAGLHRPSISAPRAGLTRSAVRLAPADLAQALPAS